MSTDPEQIRAQVTELLDGLPDVAVAAGLNGVENFDIDDVARRLEQAHDVLVHALESVEKD